MTDTERIEILEGKVDRLISAVADHDTTLQDLRPTKWWCTRCSRAIGEFDKKCRHCGLEQK